MCCATLVGFRHHLIILYKTAFYSFYLPVALAMHMAGITDESLFKQASAILLPLGEYFQVQDDYLDAYGAPEVIGKIGTDIQDNKCSWPINVVLLHATPEQRALLDQHYGRKDAKSEAIVKDLYSQPNIDIPGKFAAYETKSYQDITAQIAQVDESKGLRREVFTSFLNKVSGRVVVCRLSRLDVKAHTFGGERTSDTHASPFALCQVYKRTV